MIVVVREQVKVARERETTAIAVTMANYLKVRAIRPTTKDTPDAVVRNPRPLGLAEIRPVREGIGTVEIAITRKRVTRRHIEIPFRPPFERVKALVYMPERDPPHKSPRSDLGLHDRGALHNIESGRRQRVDIMPTNAHVIHPGVIGKLVELKARLKTTLAVRVVSIKRLARSDVEASGGVNANRQKRLGLGGIDLDRLESSVFRAIVESKT